MNTVALPFGPGSENAIYSTQASAEVAKTLLSTAQWPVKSAKALIAFKKKCHSLLAKGITFSLQQGGVLEMYPIGQPADEPCVLPPLGGRICIAFEEYLQNEVDPEDENSEIRTILQLFFRRAMRAYLEKPTLDSYIHGPVSQRVLVSRVFKTSDDVALVSDFRTVSGQCIFW
jgi:hypothetical protein